MFKKVRNRHTNNLQAAIGLVCLRGQKILYVAFKPFLKLSFFNRTTIITYFNKKTTTQGMSEEIQRACKLILTLKITVSLVHWKYLCFCNPVSEKHSREAPVCHSVGEGKVSAG